MKSSIPNTRDIVLLGGGHSHALLIRRWGMHALPGTRLTLISQNVLTPYSGMLPGFIAGHYTSDDIHIDLARLCRWANMRFIVATVSGLDLENQLIQIQDRPDIGYDVLSIDTGSTPNTRVVPGAATYAVPVKPIHRLQSHLRDFYQRLQQRPVNSAEKRQIGVVGSGVGGFELLLALDYALRERSMHYEMHWILRSDLPLKRRPEKTRRLALSSCIDKGISVHTNFDVTEVSSGCVSAADGRSLRLDDIFWCTAAAAPDWPGAAGLQVDKHGFVEINSYLQSVSHDNVFAAGDVATQVETPAPKAGVYAVRQAPILFANLRRYVGGRPLETYRPQRETLSLMALGQKSAIATRGRFTLEGDWVWHWKDFIDQQFMRKFSHLPDKDSRLLKRFDNIWQSTETSENAAIGQKLRCGGCGAKIPQTILDEVLSQLKPVEHSDIRQGLHAKRDTAIIQTSSDTMAQSVDQFRAMLDDPYLFGRIAALHAMSDLFAAGAKAHSAMALAGIPHASHALVKRDLQQLLFGALTELNLHQCALIGGHTSEASELTLGFVVNGWLEEQSTSGPSHVQLGDKVILTKPLGTGVVLSADMHARAKGVDVERVVHGMLQSNSQASAILYNYTNILTDVTGFGLLGHLFTLARSPSLSFRIQLDKIPLYPSALRLAEAGEQSTLAPANRVYLTQTQHPDDLSVGIKTLLCDPQTNGGLLAIVPQDGSERCLQELEASGYPAACIIGDVTAVQPESPCVQLLHA